jgi:carbon monoxide dehydrogenase subunit G
MGSITKEFKIDASADYIVSKLRDVHPLISHFPCVESITSTEKIPMRVHLKFGGLFAFRDVYNMYSEAMPHGVNIVGDGMRGLLKVRIAVVGISNNESVVYINASYWGEREGVVRGCLRKFPDSLVTYMEKIIRTMRSMESRVPVAK